MRTPDACYAFAARPSVTRAARNSRAGPNVCGSRAAIARHNPQGEMAMIRSTGSAAAALVLLVAGCGDMAPMQKSDAMASKSAMTFFVTSTGSGKGADFGGIAGADKHCQMLAAAADAGNRTWHAYMSTQGPGAVNARDRIGQGPWYGAKGNRIAQNVGDLHGDTLDHTCNNWTSSGAGTAMLGHFDRTGGPNTSWNAAHPSAGCSQDALVRTG